LKETQQSIAELIFYIECSNLILWLGSGGNLNAFATESKEVVALSFDYGIIEHLITPSLLRPVTEQKNSLLEEALLNIYHQ
jgi:hypothetical protein